jgi:hypothetical protein
MEEFMRAGRYKSIFWASLFFPVVIGGCSGSGSPGPAAPDSHDTSLATRSDSEPMAHAHIMEAVYYNKRVPENFYREENPPDDVFQTIRHVRNTDIIATNAPVYELCAESPDEALQWSETAKRDLGDLVDITETNLYYQFTRVPPTQPNFSNLQRIFKCELFDRSFVDLNEPDEHVGFYYRIPEKAEEIRQIIEYLWAFSLLNNYGNAVLQGVTEETAVLFEYTLYQARLVQDPDACDTINVYKTVYSMHKASGNINFSETLIDSLKTKFEAIPALCNQP